MGIGGEFAAVRVGSCEKRRRRGQPRTGSTASRLKFEPCQGTKFSLGPENEPVIRCVLLDALGTLVRLERPWPLLAAVVGVDIADAERAMRAEMSYYRDHSHEGRDAESLADLRRRCAAIVSRELEREVTPEQLMASISFKPFPDAPPALTELGELGLTRVCVSNWDCSLPSVLERCGLADHLDGVVVSAVVGARKPDPAIFTAALELAGRGPDEAIHVGDTEGEDIEGASAAGIRALLLRRDGGGDIESLAAIRHHLGS
jgi:putative hydrolase of the HAD superfamily